MTILYAFIGILGCAAAYVWYKVGCMVGKENAQQSRKIIITIQSCDFDYVNSRGWDNSKHGELR